MQRAAGSARGLGAPRRRRRARSAPGWTPEGRRVKVSMLPCPVITYAGVDRSDDQSAAG